MTATLSLYSCTTYWADDSMSSWDSLGSWLWNDCWLQRHHCTPAPWLGGWLLEFVRYRHMYLYACTEEAQENHVTTQHVQVISHCVCGIWTTYWIKYVFVDVCVLFSLFVSLFSSSCSPSFSRALSLSRTWSEGHIFLRNNNSSNSLLTVTRREFISQLRSTLLWIGEWVMSDTHTHTHEYVTHELWVVSHTHIHMSHVTRICRRDFVAQIRSLML